MALSLPLPLVAVVLAFVLWRTWRVYARVQHNSLRALPGPPNPSLLLGWAWHFWTADPTELHEEWTRIYGRTIQYRVLSDICFFTMDVKALSHVFSHVDVWQKPQRVRTVISEMLGKGVLLCEGEQHRRHKRVVNPAFGPMQIRAFTDVFLSKASQLRDILSLEVTRNAGSASVDFYAWAHRMSLDVIGEAAFSYNLGTLNVENESNELCDAFRLVSQSVSRMSFFPMLRFFFPILRIFPEEQSRRFAKARKLMAQFATGLIEEKRRELEGIGGAEKMPRRKGGDFLTLLVEANMGNLLPEGQRLSDQEIIDECTTFLVAGHETTAITTAWLFYELARHQDVQEKLRQEVLSIPDEHPTIEQLSSLHYLECVIREIIRLYPAIPSSLRVAMEDDVIPLGESVTIKGQIHDRISVSKGTPFVIPVLAINRDRAIWGEDAFEFRPERWDNLPESVLGIPGLWANNLTFLNGPHACLGYRFSLNEMKVTVFELLRAFEFEPAVPTEDIAKSPTLLARPMRVSDAEGGPQMPLLFRPYRRE